MALSSRLADRIGRQRYELWFGASARLVPHAGELTVEVASDFLQDWLRTHFRRDLELVSAEVLGGEVPVSFRINQKLAGGGHSHSEPPDDTLPEPAKAEPRTKPAADGQRTARRPAQNGCRKLADFSSFVVGNSNRLAYTSAQLAAEGSGAVSPLLIYGPTGVGKTHLLEAILAEARNSEPPVRGVYLTAEQFTSYFLEALGGRGLPTFRHKYRAVDLLLLDDLQFFHGKPATLVELLYTIETLLRQGKQVVLAADRPVTELKGLGPELAARLSGGLVCPVKTPDDTTRREMVRTLAERLQIVVPDDVQQLVATRVTATARELAGAMHRIQAVSLSEQRPVTRALAEDALADLIADDHGFLGLPDIQRAVCDVFRIPAKTFASRTSGRSLNHVRMLAMFLARKHTRAALSEIGEYFGRRSHSSVISAQKKVQTWLTDETPLSVADRTWDIQDAIDRVEQSLGRAS